MKKEKNQFICSECGFVSVKMYGRCPECGSWDSMSERHEKTPNDARRASVKLETIEIKDFNRVHLKNKNLDRIFGEGIVKGEVVLLAGQPGAGKSTLAMKIIDEIDVKNILYVSGEESEKQLKIRADRVMKRVDFSILTTNCLEDVLENLEGVELLIIDSIQTISSEKLGGVPGSPAMVKYVASELIDIVKKRDIPVILIGHITKDGMVAGPKTLEHIVDAVFLFDIINDTDTRILKSVKNRYGSTDEMALLKMDSKGLTVVDNMDALCIGKSGIVGSAIACTVQGSLPIAIEMQSLVSFSRYGFPQRVATGISMKRMQMLVGVMDKYLDAKLGNMDIFINVSNGLSVNDSLLDLSVVAAMVSSFKNKNIEPSTAFVGEVGLSGEVSTGRMMELRVKHLEQIGVKKIFMPESKINSGVIIKRIKNIKELEELI